MADFFSKFESFLKPRINIKRASKLNLEYGIYNSCSPPLFGAKLDLALGAKYNLEGPKVQGFKVTV